MERREICLSSPLMYLLTGVPFCSHAKKFVNGSLAFLQMRTIHRNEEIVLDGSCGCLPPFTHFDHLFRCRFQDKLFDTMRLKWITRMAGRSIHKGRRWWLRCRRGRLRLNRAYEALPKMLQCWTSKAASRCKTEKGQCEFACNRCGRVGSCMTAGTSARVGDDRVWSRESTLGPSVYCSARFGTRFSGVVEVCTVSQFAVLKGVPLSPVVPASAELRLHPRVQLVSTSLLLLQAVDREVLTMVVRRKTVRVSLGFSLWCLMLSVVRQHDCDLFAQHFLPCVLHRLLLHQTRPLESAVHLVYSNGCNRSCCKFWWISLVSLLKEIFLILVCFFTEGSATTRLGVMRSLSELSFIFQEFPLTSSVLVDRR